MHGGGEVAVPVLPTTRALPAAPIEQGMMHTLAHRARPTGITDGTPATGREGKKWAIGDRGGQRRVFEDVHSDEAFRYLLTTNKTKGGPEVHCSSFRAAASGELGPTGDVMHRGRQRQYSPSR